METTDCCHWGNVSVFSLCKDVSLKIKKTKKKHYKYYKYFLYSFNGIKWINWIHINTVVNKYLLFIFIFNVCLLHTSICKTVTRETKSRNLSDLWEESNRCKMWTSNTFNYLSSLSSDQNNYMSFIFVLPCWWFFKNYCLIFPLECVLLNKLSLVFLSIPVWFYNRWIYKMDEECYSEMS